MDIYPGLKATEGAEVMVFDRARAFPTRDSQPVFKHLTGWFSLMTFYLFTARKTRKIHSFSFHFYSPVPIEVRATDIGHEH